LLLEGSILEKYATDERIAAYLSDWLVVIYDREAFKKALKGAPMIIGDNFLSKLEKEKKSGGIYLSGLSFDRLDVSCNDMPVVSSSVAAVKGYGPLAYEIVMANYGLGPDRISVSSKAKSVWTKFSQRDDVSIHPYDDIDSPKTPTPKDDCDVYQDVELDASYTLPPDAKAASKVYIKRHKAFEKEFMSNHDGDLGMIFKRAHNTVFDMNYG